LDSLERQENNAIEKIELIGQSQCSREYPTRLKKINVLFNIDNYKNHDVSVSD
jgi:hypothetical protein|tara:strand:- start:90 stop:248 length:159 start_codon:yes stop_codon:yes gene_type:complete